MKYRVMMAALLAGLATPAYAQEVSGFRLEGRIGWEQARTKASIPNPDEDEDVEGDEFLTASEKDSNVNYGFEVGYDAQIGRSFVLGAYAGADFSDSESCVELIEDDLACGGLKRNFTIGARAGLPFGRSSLAYVKGGYSNGRLRALYDVDVTDNDDDDAGEIETFSETRGGWHAGGGVELGLTQHIYAKVEYVYTKYGSRSYLLEGVEDDTELNFQTHRHQALAGIGLRF